MIITRTPMRISFVGGATDLKNYYSEYGGKVISCAINKYIYVTLNKRDDDRVIASYSEIEKVCHVNDLKHSIIREALKLAHIEKGVEIHIISDISTIGTGLGGSGTVTVGILKALFPEKTQQEIAELACQLEIDILKKPIGKQDQYACAKGGLNQIVFEKDGKVNMTYISYHEILKNHLYLIKINYPNKRDKAEKILEKQNKLFQKNAYILHQIKNLCRPFKEAISKDNMQKMINILNRYWELKKKLGDHVTNKYIDEIADRYLKKNCAVKICGAGQSGYLFVYDPSEQCEGIPVKIDYLGTTVVNDKLCGSI